jgi:hypothetical protein
VLTRENAGRQEANRESYGVTVSRVRRTVRALAVAMGAAVVAGTAAVLGLSAYLDVEWDPSAAVLLALAAVWIPQALIVFSRGTRRKPLPAADEHADARKRLDHVEDPKDLHSAIYDWLGHGVLLGERGPRR